MALGDIFFSICHGFDHLYIQITKKALHEGICKAIGFMMVWSLNSSVLIACLVTFSAFILVVLSRCAIRLDLSNSVVLVIIYTGMFLWVNFVVAVFTYSAVFYKLIRSTMRVSKVKDSSGSGGKFTSVMTSQNKRVAQRFITFIMLLIVQWLPGSIYIVLSVLLPPESMSLSLLVCVVLFSNLGGLFNGIVYSGFSRDKTGGGSSTTGGDMQRSTVLTKMDNQR